jgi:prevent-host-death family protein
MKTLTIRELREKLTQIERLVSEQGEILITRRGRPVAKILPLGPRRLLRSRSALRQMMPVMNTPSEKLIRAERDER